MLFKDAHIAFLNYLEVIKNKSPKTIEQYDRHLKKFSQYLADDSIKISQITLEKAEAFRVYLYQNSKKPLNIKTANAYMITLRSFLKFLEKK